MFRDRLMGLATGAVLLGCLAGVAVGADEPAPPDVDGAVVVEAVGRAPAKAGEDVQSARRQALLDARANALLQVGMAVEAATTVENLQLRRALVRSWALGLVQDVEMLEEGPVPGSDPPAYRVRIRASVVPLAESDLAAVAARWGGAAWQPVVRLSIEGDLDTAALDDLRSDLARALARSGIAVVAQEAGRPSLELRVQVSGRPERADAPARVTWEMGFGRAGAEAPDSPTVSSTGRLMVGSEAAGQGEWLEWMGLGIAQDAVRLWVTERPTTVRFVDCDRETVAKLVKTLSRVPRSSGKVPKGVNELVAIMPTAGDPRGIIEPLLAEAGLEGKLEPAETRLAYCVYRFVPLQAEGGPPSEQK